MIVYAARAWFYTVKIDSLQRKLLLRLAGTYRTISSELLEAALSILPLDLEVERRGILYSIRKDNLVKVMQMID